MNNTSAEKALSLEFVKENTHLHRNIATKAINAITPETLNELREGSHEAYRTIYLTYKESIEFFLFKLTRSEEEAREITQEIFVNVWEKRRQVDTAKSIKSYLYSIAKNSALNYFAHQKVVERYHTANPFTEEAGCVSDEQLIARETELLIEIAVSRMPKQRRRIFELSQYEGLSNEEIATRLEMNKLTVANHLANARKDIKDILTLFFILFMSR